MLTEESDKALDARRKDAEEGILKMLEIERAHITKLDAVHEQLRLVETRHAIRIDKLESSLADLSRDKDELLAMLQVKESRLAELSGRLEAVQGQMVDVLSARDGRDSELVNVLLENEKVKLDGYYRNEISLLVDDRTSALHHLDSKEREVRDRDAELLSLRVELQESMIEKRVLSDLISRLGGGEISQLTTKEFITSMGTALQVDVSGKSCPSSPLSLSQGHSY